MDWYIILLIGIGAIVGLFLIIFLLSKLTKPKFKRAKKYLTPKTPEPLAVKKEIKSESISAPTIGLNFKLA